MKTIQLTKGKVAIVSDEDYEDVSRHKWTASWSGSKWYVVRTITTGGKSAHELLHRRLLNAPSGILVDHRDGDGLNNCRGNLRLATQGQNAQNQKLQARPKLSRFKGVTFSKNVAERPWQAHIKIAGKKTVLGSFVKEERAAQAYNEAAIKHFGDFSCLNDVAEGCYDSSGDIIGNLPHSDARQRGPKTKGCSSSYKGVNFVKQSAQWMSRIMVDKKSLYLGRFTSEVEAALAYNAAALHHFGPHARLNEVPA